MHARIGLLNGEIIVGDDLSHKELQDLIDESDGLLGSGDFEHARVEDVDDAIAFMTRILHMAYDDQENGKFNVLVSGENVVYDSCDVAWFRIVQ